MNGWGIDIVSGNPSVYSNADLVGYAGSPHYVGADPSAKGNIMAPPGFGMPLAFAPPAQVMAQAPARTSVMPATGGQHIRRQILPFGTATVAPGGTANLTVLTQRPMRVDRLTVTQYVSPFGAVTQGIQITGLTVGVDPQFSAAGDVDAANFAPGAFGTELRGSTANPGITITLSLRNPTAAAIDVNSTIIGESLD